MGEDFCPGVAKSPSHAAISEPTEQQQLWPVYRHLACPMQRISATAEEAMHLQTRRARTPGYPLYDRGDVLHLVNIALESSMLSDPGPRPEYAREQRSSIPDSRKSGSWYWAVLVLLVAAMVAATAAGIFLRLL